MDHLNPNLFGGKRRKVNRAKADDLLQPLLDGDRAALSKAITLIESTAKADQAEGNKLIQACLPHAGNSIRIGITGLPGAGKSSFIEVFGLHLIEEGAKVAVLAVDPSSTLSQGSILGDKTRMEELSVHEKAFIRPSPTGNTLGGVNRRTRESIILCEAAGYSHIIVETVGVGQSETAVHSLTDLFILVLLTGGGDDLQGIKCGVMELADLILINKADGDNLDRAKRTRSELAKAIHFLPPHPANWKTEVMPVSALEQMGIDSVWDKVQEYQQHCKENGYWQQKRNQQALFWFKSTLSAGVLQRIENDEELQAQLSSLEARIKASEIDPFFAAEQFLDQLFKA